MIPFTMDEEVSRELEWSLNGASSKIFKYLSLREQLLMHAGHYFIFFPFCV